jgi:hypothetical protein
MMGNPDEAGASIMKDETNAAGAMCRLAFGFF